MSATALERCAALGMCMAILRVMRIIVTILRAALAVIVARTTTIAAWDMCLLTAMVMVLCIAMNTATSIITITMTVAVAMIIMTSTMAMKRSVAVGLTITSKKTSATVVTGMRMSAVVATSTALGVSAGGHK